MSEVTLADLIGNAAEQQPEAFRQSFDQLMHDKVVAALDVKKQEVAQNLITPQQSPSLASAEDTPVENT